MKLQLKALVGKDELQCKDIVYSLQLWEKETLEKYAYLDRRGRSAAKGAISMGDSKGDASVDRGR